MEALAIISGIAAVPHLVEITSKVIDTLRNLNTLIRHASEELRRQQLALASMQQKLQLLQPDLEKVQRVAGLPADLWLEFAQNLYRLQGEVDTVVRSVRPLSSEHSTMASWKSKLRFYLVDHKALNTAMKHLQSLEANLDRIERAVQLKLLVLLCDETLHGEIKKKLPSQVSCFDSPFGMIKRSRSSLLKFDSPWRHHGAFAWLTHEQGPTEDDAQITIGLGLCFSFWFLVFCLSIEFCFIDMELHGQWLPHCWIRMRNRVSSESPLIQACQQGNVRQVTQLMKSRGISINDQLMCSGKSALLVAIEAEQIEVVESLLKLGADPNLSDDDQITPLFAVTGMKLRRNAEHEQLPPTWDRWLDAFRLLIEYGACPFEKVRGRSIATLNIVRPRKPSKTLDFLRILSVQDHLQLDTMTKKGCWSAFKNALRSGDHAVDCLTLLHSTGINLARAADGRTALHLAAQWSYDSRPIEYLLSIGQINYIDHPDAWGWTPLHYAIIDRESAISSMPFSKVTGLLSNGADPTVLARKNPLIQYRQPVEPFTPGQLLRYARPARYVQMLRISGHFAAGLAAEPNFVTS